MMQNNPMGAMMPQGVAPPAPTGLNFQSDPSMRAQFKGFMSGMQAKQPAPMAPMMQQPLPMPAPMQNIDIFQPMGMEMGGAVPRSTQIAGQPHMLSYITPGEANVLQAMGGSGAPGPGGIPSFFSFDTPEFGVSGGGYSDPYESPGTAGTVNFSSGGPEEAAFGGSDDGNRYDSLGNTVNFTSASAPPTASDGDPAMDALAQALANTAQVNAAEQARQQATIDPALSQRLSEVQLADVTPGQIGGAPQSLTGASRAVDAIDFDPNLGFREFDRNIDLLGDPFNPNDIQAMQNPVSVPGPNFVSPSIQPMTSEERTQMELDEAGRDASIGAGMNEGQISGAPQLGFDLGGMGAEGEAVPAPSSAVQQAADKARAEALDITGYDPNAEVPEIFTTDKGNAAMDKLLDRAQNFKESGIGGFLNKILADGQTLLIAWPLTS